MVMNLVVWDVQHGSAAYLKTPTDKHIVLDLGTGSNKNKEFSPLLHLKNKYNISQLDKVVITHPHTDHIDDIFNFDILDPKIIVRPKHLSEEDIRGANKQSDADKVNKYLEINNRYCVKVPMEEDPSIPQNNGGVTLSTFIPKRCSTSNINNHSVVTLVQYHNAKILMPGDNEEVSWLELLEDASFRTAIQNTDIMIASHHGRDNGYCSKLFDYFKPKLVIISDGAATTTNASSKYSAIATGWTVHRRNGTSVERKCLTTRNDGVIHINVGKNNNQRTFIEVICD